jgi:transcriptional regulator with XRE-family HTH domain
MTGDYDRALGKRLRSVRVAQKMSLRVVQEKSQGRWKAVVVGSYERGDRSVTVVALAELADFYGVPVAELLPGTSPWAASSTPTLTMDLRRLSEIPADQGGPLARFATAIKSQRGDYNGKVLSIRVEDLRALAVMYDMSPDELTEQLIGWGVLPPGTTAEG